MVNRTLKIISFGILMLVLTIPALAQNTKGDKPTPSRENRVKARKEKPARRVKSSRRATSSLRAYKPRKKSRGGERAGRPLAPTMGTRPSERSRNNVYPQRGAYVNNNSKTPRGASDRGRVSRNNRVNARSATGRTRNVYPQTGTFVNHSSAVTRKPPRTRKVVPRSASKSFTARKSINSWAHFRRPKQKTERASTKDIAGRKLRTRNFETKRPPLTNVPAGGGFSGTGRRRNIAKGGGGRISASQSGRGNTYSQSGKYVNNYNRRAKTGGAGRTTASILSTFPRTPDRGTGRKRKVVPRSASQPFMKRKSTNTWAHFPRPKRKGERAITTDIAGKPLRTKNFESQRPTVHINPTSRIRKPKKNMGERAYKGTGGGYATATRSGKAWRGDVSKRRIRRNFSSKPGIEGNPASSPEKRHKGMRQQGERYTGNARGGRNFSDQGEEFNGMYKSRRKTKDAGRGYSGNLKPGGRAFNNQGEEFTGTYKSRRKTKDAGRGYSGNLKPGGRAFNNQGEEYTGGTKTRRPLKGGGSASGKLWNNQGSAIPARTPGMGGKGVGYSGNLKAGKRALSNQGEGYAGNRKTRRPLKGGGSVSGKLWNNQGSAIPARTPGMGGKGVGYSGNLKAGKRALSDQGEGYAGNRKTRRPLKGGGSVSGKLWNNQGSAIPARTPGVGGKGVGYSGNLRGGRRIFNNQGEEYTGSIKARRFVKGGGSVSGKLWNNKQYPIAVRVPRSAQGGEYRGNLNGGRRIFNNQGEEYTGNIKARRLVKGGGSVSGKLWNNKQYPIAVRVPKSAQGGEYRGNLNGGRRIFNNQGEEYTGNLKARRPVKGGGSVSGKLWNNKEVAIAVREPKSSQGGEYRGNLRGGRRIFNNQGEEYTGNIKAKKPLKGGGSVSGKLWNNNEMPIAAREPKSDQGGEYSGNIKVKKAYVKNPNSAEEALKKRRPLTTYDVDGLQIRVKRPEYARRDNAPEGSVPGLKPSKASIKAGEFASGMKKYRYVRNPNNAEGALKVRETGKAFARATDYQGNIKMRKYDLFGKRGLHPDAQFMKLNKNNVAEEKDLLTNFKLWWARLFRKNETVPDHLKDKRGKPRYDKGEAGLWYD